MLTGSTGKRNGDTPNQQGVKSTAEHTSKPPRVRNRHGPGKELAARLLQEKAEEAQRVEHERERVEAEAQHERERIEKEREDAEAAREFRFPASPSECI